MKKNKIETVAFLDSGYGGLLTAAYVHKFFPHLNVVCILDNINMLYGTKEISELNHRYTQLQKKAKESEVDLAVIACNTLSATSHITEKKLVETVDIISMSLDFLNKKNFNRLKILATPNTIKSNIYTNGLNNVAYLDQIPAPKLATFIENGLMDEAVLNFKSLISDSSEEIFLGCTHYSALIPFFSDHNIHSQLSVLTNYLNENYFFESEIKKGEVKIYVNAELVKYASFAEKLFPDSQPEVMLDII